MLDHILSECGSPEKVRFRDAELVNKLIQTFVDGGTANLQVITDFDFTLSKAHTKGNKCSPAADIIRQSSLMSDEFRARARKRFDKLLPVELDPSLTIEEKIPTVVASFREGFADLVSSKKVNKESLTQMIDKSDESCHFQFRDNIDTTLKILHEAKVPVLIFSAGFGDLIDGLLSKDSMYYPNIHVIANFMEFNDGELVSFKEPLIHTYNKNESVIPENSKYFNELTHRKNVLLLGDSIGDVEMGQGICNGNIMKIGFLNVHMDENLEEQLEIFMRLFDVVLVNDESMNFVNLLLKFLK